jgi:hypothetical protein
VFAGKACPNYFTLLSINRAIKLLEKSVKKGRKKEERSAWRVV